MKKLVLLSFALTIAVATSLMAQPPSPPDDLGPDPIPVDGGVSMLLVAGAAYGSKKLKAFRAAKTAE